MTIETRIYSNDERPRIVIISHGSSESVIIYDSQKEVDKPIPKARSELFYNPIENIEKEIT
jgi:hypothetical protein